MKYALKFAVLFANLINLGVRPYRRLMHKGAVIPIPMYYVAYDNRHEKWTAHYQDRNHRVKET